MKKTSLKTNPNKKTDVPSASTHDAQQSRHLPPAAIIEEKITLKETLKLKRVIYLLLLSFIIWAALIQIQEVAMTNGQIVPRGKIPVVQHLEGGIVKKVLVKEGTRVHKGQSLVKLSSSEASSELERMRSREITLSLDAKRLRSFLYNEKSSSKTWEVFFKQRHQHTKYLSNIITLLKNEALLLKSENSSRKQQRAIIQNQIEQKQSEVTQLDNKKKVQKEQIKLLTEELNMFKELLSKNMVSRRSYLKMRREINNVKGKLLELSDKKIRAIQALQETKNRLHELNSKIRKTALTNLGELNSELLQIQRGIVKLEDRVERLNVTAPVTGVVKELKTLVGRVITPGEVLMEIVPLSQEMQAEIKIKPKDIGHVKLSDHVKVRISTFDYAKYGNLTGTLISISPSTFLDSKNEPYFKGTIKLSRQYVGEKAEHNRLLPGMAVEADIITGKRSLLQYLLKPIHTATSESFRER